MYAKTFKITGCDHFTQNFMHKMGVRINAPEEVPDDPYTSHRKAVSGLLTYNIPLSFLISSCIFLNLYGSAKKNILFFSSQ